MQRHVQLGVAQYVASSIQTPGLAARTRTAQHVADDRLGLLTQRAMVKLGARDRAQLMVVAYRTGLVRA